MVAKRSKEQLTCRWQQRRGERTPSSRTMGRFPQKTPSVQPFRDRYFFFLGTLLLHVTLDAPSLTESDATLRGSIARRREYVSKKFLSLLVTCIVFFFLSCFIYPP
jgi:hypothetical protein